MLILQFFLSSAIVESDMEQILSSIGTILPYAQIVISILLVLVIILQQRGSSIGGAFGSDNFSATYHKRRGAELFLFQATIVLAILFVAAALFAIAL